MHRIPSYLRLFAAAFAFLVGSSAMLPAVAAVHMMVFCCEDEVEVVPPAPPCHPVEEETPTHMPASTALICCLTESGIEPAPVPRIHQEVHQSLVAVEHPALIIEKRPIQVFGQELLEQVPRGIPSVGLPVLHASLLI